MKAVSHLPLPDGGRMPVLGQGTWELGEHASRFASEASALSAGIDLGMTLIDTAEMYGDGRAERLVGEVIAGRRDKVFLVSKVLPSNASRQGVVAACERSLGRLRTDRLDLYLLHWQGSHPLAETVAGFERLVRDGKIVRWGVSNLDLCALQALHQVPGGAACQTDQVLYNLTRRGIEADLLPWAHESGMPLMAYSPLERGGMLNHPVLQRVAQRHGASPAELALAWVLRHPGVAAIPKAASMHHVESNRAALEVRLTDTDLQELDRAFPAPRRPVPLEMI